MNSTIIRLLISFSFLITSCGSTVPQQTPNNSNKPSSIEEPQIGETFEEITVQEIRTNNCDGKNPSTTVSRSLIQEQTTFFEVVVEAGGLIRGTAIPNVLEAELEAKIKTALGSNIGNKFEQTISTVFDIPAGEAILHKIYWNETKIAGFVDVVYQDGTATLGFQKVIGIEMYDRDSESLGCDESHQPTDIATLVNHDSMSQTPIFNGDSSPSETPEITRTQIYLETLKPQSREEILLDYDDVFNNYGWCSLWEKLVTDKLVTGDCPVSVLRYEKANDIKGPNGNPIYGAQLRIDSEIEINYPACVTYNEAYASAMGERKIPWVNNDILATNVTMEKNSLFTIYFRCEDTIVMDPKN